MPHQVGDIRDAAAVTEAVERVRPEFVFHLAAQPLVRLSYREPVATYATNVMGTAHVLEAVRRAGRPCIVIAVTTDKCYENKEWLHGYREEDPLGGYDPYSSSKAAAELVVAAYRRSFFQGSQERVPEICLASARAGNVIGGGDWAEDRIVQIASAPWMPGRKSRSGTKPRLDLGNTFWSRSVAISRLRWSSRRLKSGEMLRSSATSAPRSISARTWTRTARCSACRGDPEAPQRLMVGQVGPARSARGGSSESRHRQGLSPPWMGASLEL
jgi:hypothetical protein